MTARTRTLALVALVALAAGLATVPAEAAAGDKLLRTRVIYIAPNDGASGILDDVAKAEVEYDITVELDFSYFFTDNVALEVIFATAAQEVKLPGLPDEFAVGDSIGSVYHAPATFLAQYHFNPGGMDFYVGAGINYTIFYGESGAIEELDIDSGSFGYAAQIGVDFPLSENMVFNIDLKYITIGTDVELGGESLGEIDVDPFVLGFGVGFRF